MKSKDLCLHKSNIKSIFSELERIVNNTDKRLRLTIKIWRDKRSINQNNLMWMWNEEIAKQVTKLSGEQCTDEEIHEFYKDKFCPEKEITVNGETRKVKSTKLLDIGEMHKYLTDLDYEIHRVGMKLTIPDNSEYKKLQAVQCE